jgi:hypothetical protein
VPVIVVPGASFGSSLVNSALSAHVRLQNREALAKSHLPVPHKLAAPRLSGTAVKGGTLTISRGRWASRPTKYGFGWKECDKHAARCTTITNAAQRSYTLGTSDIGHVVVGRVTASNAAGATIATTAPSALVAAAAVRTSSGNTYPRCRPRGGGRSCQPAAPVNTGSPVVTGTAQQGDTLAVSNGAWSGSPTGFSYAWQDCDASGSNCSPISGAGTSSYTLQASDVGHTIKATVTATNAGGSASATTNATTVVTAPTPAAPVNTGSPVITGTAQQGQLLAVSNGSWSGSPTGFSYAWQDRDASGSNCSPIGGAGTSSYTLQASDVGDTIEAIVTATNAGGSATATTNATAVVTAATSEPPGVFPLRVSSNGRYLVSAQGSPWLMVGDSPQSTVGNLSVASSDAYFADRAAHGFDAVWTNLLCESYTECSDTAVSYDGVRPFTTGSGQGSYDLSTPNSAYFARAHQMVADAGADGIEVLLDPIPTDNCNPGSFYTTLINNGNGKVSTTDKDYQYGEYLGNEFKDLPNVMWFNGNDFSCYFSDAAANNDLISVSNGIKATDPGALQTNEIGLGGNNSSDDWSNWHSTLSVNGSYTYWATYGLVREAYEQTASSPAELPVFMMEANYEGQQNSGDDGCLENDAGWRHCREQEWWTMTSGATGQLYGGPCYGMTNSTSLSSCDTTGVRQLGYVTQLLDQIDWWKLVPDGNHDGAGRTYVTSGGGTCTGWQYNNFGGNDCVTDATIPDGSGINTLLAYYPDPSSFGTITVDMSKFTGPVTARWYDPTDGVYSAVSGSPFTNSGTHAFAPSTNNSAGDKDWVLLLQG